MSPISIPVKAKSSVPFMLALARNQPDAAIDRIRKFEELRNFCDRYQGGSLGTEVFLRTMVQAGVRKHAFSVGQLRELYSIIRPAESTNSRLVSYLRFAFQNLGEIIRRVSPEDVNSLSDPWDSYAAAGIGSQAERDEEKRKRIVGQFDGPKTVRDLATLFREAIANSSLPWLGEKWPEATAIATQMKRIPEVPEMAGTDPAWKQWWSMMRYRIEMRSVPNVLGLSFLRAAISSELTQAEVQDWFLDRTNREQARLLVAIELFARTYGHMPRSLGDLSALHLPGPDPVDYFAGGPFHYDLSKHAVWSVGFNGKDDGGRRATFGDDIVATLP